MVKFNKTTPLPTPNKSVQPSNGYYPNIKRPWADTQARDKLDLYEVKVQTMTAGNITYTHSFVTPTPPTNPQTAIILTDIIMIML